MLAIAALALGAAGCASQSAFRLTSLATTASSSSTITFESIDGPPPEVFRKLVANLNDEAQARRIAVVSRAEPSTYRVRGYVSALVDRDKTSFGWVWDVYDADKNRALRITGEELAAAGRGRDAHRDAWTAADEQVLRRMASNGMEQIAAYLNASPPPQAAPPAEGGIVLAAARDDTPEAAGIFRLFAPGEATPATTGSASVPEPAAEAIAPPAQPKRAKPPIRRPATTAAALDVLQ